jgi:hypothetical protein
MQFPRHSGVDTRFKAALLPSTYLDEQVNAGKDEYEPQKNKGRAATFAYISFPKTFVLFIVVIFVIF